jgi:tetratricopeptide (TPR) repeat protein
MINSPARNRLLFLLVWLYIFWTTLLPLSPPDTFAQTERPMFDQPDFIRPDKKTAEAFVREATSKYRTREAASRAFAAQGWAQLRDGKNDLALKSFERAWLLNAKNYQVFWGAGAVLGEQGNLIKAIEMLETARELIEDPEEAVALLLDMATVNSTYAASLPKDKQLDRAHYFVRANQCFAESLEINPGYAASWRAWALSLYDQERYSEAFIKAQRAQELKAEPLPANFLRDLKNKIGE